jgi:hypothetical protein
MTSPPLLWPPAPRETRILYLARFAPDDPFYTAKPESTTTGYAEYHFRIFEALRDRDAAARVAAGDAGHREFRWSAITIV